MNSSQPWFERSFTFDLPLSRFPVVLERLRGTPARIEERLLSVSSSALVVRFQDKWSIQENVGHLCDLEPIWTRRAEQLLRGEAELAAADLSNRATDDANYNAVPIGVLLERFRSQRSRFVSVLENADDSALNRTARHPRLGTPMRLIDVAFFTAEHDDHHLARITVLLNATK
jgi:uncharacterized damage-inducible protein DinB